MKDKYVYPRPISTSMSPGMELRDWFAGQAVIGLLSNPKHDDDDSEHIALVAYGVANCLMEEREEN